MIAHFGVTHRSIDDLMKMLFKSLYRIWFKGTQHVCIISWPCWIFTDGSILIDCMIYYMHSGFGEWEDPQTKTRCRILPRKPQELASDIYEWATSRGYINSVCTVYELHSGTCPFLFHLCACITMCSFKRDPSPCFIFAFSSYDLMTPLLHTQRRRCSWSVL